MQELAPEIRAAAERGFTEAAFVNDVGIVMHDCGAGWCEAGLVLQPRHLQHTGIVHAGVQTTLADHAAGCAAITLLPIGQYVLTAEFKLHLLRPAGGESLWCRAQVLKPGKTVIVVESEVFAVEGGQRRMTGKLSATMVVLQST
jgi:uncharacterized protein (TIGR00369 family)